MANDMQKRSVIAQASVVQSEQLAQNIADKPPAPWDTPIPRKVVSFRDIAETADKGKMVRMESEEERRTAYLAEIEQGIYAYESEKKKPELYKRKMKKA